MTGSAITPPPARPPIPNPVAAREPELLGRLTTLRDHVCDRLFDQLAAEAVKDSGFRPCPHPAEDVRAMALALRTLTKPQWDADDLRLLDACWKPATRAELFAEVFEADRTRIEQMVAAARGELTATAPNWAAKVGNAGPRQGGQPRAAGSRKAATKPPATPPSVPAASAEPPAPSRCMTADAGNDTLVVLIEDTARGRLQIAFEHPSGQAQPPRAIQAFLRENGFEPEPAGNGSVFGRPLNLSSTFQDKISGEWVVLQAAEQMQGGKKARRG